MNVRRYIYPIYHFKNAEKDNIKEELVVAIQRYERVTLKIKAVNN